MPSSYAAPIKRKKTKYALALLATASVLLSALIAPPASAAEPTSTNNGDLVFSDSFDRTVAQGWSGPSNTQSYGAPLPSALSVDGSTGIANLTPGLFMVNAIPSVNERDATIRGVLSTDTAPAAGNGATISLALRSTGTASSYQARARVATDGRIALSVSRYDGSFGKETLLANRTALTGLAAGTKVNLEFEVEGTSPVELRTRTWLEGTATPDWQVNVVDSSEARIRHAGAAAVGLTLSSGTKALSIAVDDVQVRNRTKASTPPPPVEPTKPPVEPTKPPIEPTVEPTKPPIEPTVEPTIPPTAGSAGSLPVGASRYSIPASAVYVTAGGSASGSGTLAAPYKSVQHAIDRSPSGSTLVLRAGSYYESIFVPGGKKLTIQSYPGEPVWFDGSSRVTGFVKSGSTWLVNNWNYNFDSRVSFNSNIDESHRFVDPAYPMAGHPDQVWINGVAQRQVGSAAQVSNGTFFVDKNARRLVLGSDPTGKAVDASTLTKAIKVHGQGTTLRGFGVRKYATTLNMMGAVSVEVPNNTLENLVVTQNATVGVYAWGANNTFNKLTVSDNGLMGGGANSANGLSVKESKFVSNNTEKFKWAPVSGGLKITKSDGIVVSNSLFEGSTMGLWLDESVYDATVTGNMAKNNSRTGFLVELTEKALVANNHSVGNDRGLTIQNAGSIDVWNNTFSGNARTLEFLQDQRRQSNPSLANKIPWITRNVHINNNVLSYGTGSCPVLTQDLETKMYGNSFGITFNANLYQRASTSSPSNLACWANGTAGTRSFKTLALFKAHTGSDAGSVELTGAPALTAGLTLTPAAAATKGLSPRAIPASIAAKIGVAANSAEIGAISAPIG